MAGKSSPVLTIDLTDDDVESLGVEIWSESGYATGNSTAHQHSSHSISHNDEIPGTSSASAPMNSTMVGDFEFESEEYLKLLQKMQDDFNKEFEEMDDDVLFVDTPAPLPVVEPVPVTKVEKPSTSRAHTSIPSTSKSDANNNLSAPKTFQMIDVAPACQKYFYSPFTPTNKTFLAAIGKEHKLLENDLPPGIFVKTFENRLDLISALIEGPVDTPYEGCLFMFDIQLHKEHPKKPPKVHYWSFCRTKLNPNLYTTGIVCLSLLGTWAGQSSVERWSTNSTIYQLLISIQGLILVPEPYYNEPAYHSARLTGAFKDASKLYNSKTLLLVLQSMTNQINNPPAMFRDKILEYYRTTAKATFKKLIRQNAKESSFPIDMSKHKNEYQIALKVLELAIRKKLGVNVYET
ncbi:(E3-independent) E2 ubiquitin-conjugating enzyme-like [Culicoides brevitarsis]|uniref:(E3-independent) E2 ubiquitin-conjugating enzyme-like n=1 Tax=Culicoides brevitarsis TaxID=469753 RepID=UPI00307B3266